MNKYFRNLNRIEFIVTWNCTGKCKHCSVGERTKTVVHIDKDVVSGLIHQVAEKYNIESVMTFGGESLLYPESVCAIHLAAKKVNIPKRQLITNGFFSKDNGKIKSVVDMIAESGVNDILLSVDAFHQETIPVDVVKQFAIEVVKSGVPIRTSPAWLVSKEHNNPYNNMTHKLIAVFKEMGIEESSGNIVFPEGNAKKYLSEYLSETDFKNPYVEDPYDVKSISIEPDGSLFGRNVYKYNVIKLLEEYRPF